ncbi:MAG: hypothetical protein FWF50_07870 [Defluviitaleaceae bacterium]|nr:hypothetical protein [Defluviitaleaceae bacterium]
MVKFKELYTKAFNEQTEVLETLKEYQQEAEEVFLNIEDYEEAYKEAYLKLFEAHTEAIEFIKNSQLKSEELYLEMAV